VDGLGLSPHETQEVMAQAANLGNAKVPKGMEKVLAGKETKGGEIAEALPRIYREEFIGVYGDVLRLAAALAFLGAVMGLLFVRGKPAADRAARGKG